MAAMESARPKTAANGYETAPAPLPTSPPQAEIAKLAALYREAEETAHLANLLGRAPFAAAILALAAIVTSLSTVGVPVTHLAGWLALMMFGLGALARSYARVIREPFERAPLFAFAQDLSAILGYAGFAWGVGAFLVLPASTGLLAATAFATIPPALVAMALRTRDTALLFLGPAAALSAFAMVLRPLPDGALAAALTVAAAAAVAGAVVWFTRPHVRSLPHLAELSLGQHSVL